MVQIFVMWALKTHHQTAVRHDTDSGVARTFPGGLPAHPEGQNEDEN